MAELGNLTYNVTVNDEVTKELEQLRDIVNIILNRVKVLESKNSKRPIISIDKSYDDYLKEWETITSETYLGNGKLDYCGMGVGIGPENKIPPFIVQDGQVFISGAKVENKEEPKHKPFITVDGETYISNTRLTDLGISFCGGKDGSSAILNITKN